MAHFKTAKQIINRVAIEVGVAENTSPFSSADTSFVQLRALINSCGYELIEEHPWNVLRREHTFTTDSGTNPDGEYDLPSDFVYMIDQTGWSRTQRVPLFGPVSAQKWAYLEGRQFANNTIYASFRLTEGKLFLYPTPPPDSQSISYEYISDNWVDDEGGGTFTNECDSDSDIVLFEPRLIERLLKLRFLQARGFDTTAALQEYQRSLNLWMGREKSAPILNAGGRGWEYPYIEARKNAPDTGYGS